MKNDRVVYFDFETGGIEPEKPEIQLAAAAFCDGKELDSIELKIRFDESRCDPEALSLNRYSKEVWARKAVLEASAVDSFAAFLKRHATVELTSKAGRPYVVARLAGHNAASFDFPRLQAMFKRNGGAFLPAAFQVLDTLQRALWFGTENGLSFNSYRLKDLCDYFGIATPDAHDALADVRSSAALANAIAWAEANS